MPEIGTIKPSTVIRVNTEAPQNPTLRPPVKVSLGCHIPGVSMPHVDPSDVNTVIAGVKKRFACKPPDPEADLLVRLKTFTALWCCQNLTPLSHDTDVDVDTWLESTGYSRGRINQLKRNGENVVGNLKKNTTLSNRLSRMNLILSSNTHVGLMQDLINSNALLDRFSNKSRRLFLNLTGS